MTHPPYGDGLDEGGGYPSEDEIMRSASAAEAEDVVEALAAEAAAEQTHHAAGLLYHRGAGGSGDDDDPFELATAPLVISSRTRRRLDRAVKEHLTPRGSAAGASADGGAEGSGSGSDASGSRRSRRRRGGKGGRVPLDDVTDAPNGGTVGPASLVATPTGAGGGGTLTADATGGPSAQLRE